MGKKITIEEFKEKANKVHNNFYDYSQSEYNDSYNKIKIICPLHGEFFQMLHHHLYGQKCPKCHIDTTKTPKKDFLEKASDVHNNFYDYSQCDYINMKTKIKIICPIHGEFFQNPSSHIRGQKCFKCSTEDRKTTQHEFEQKANQVHNNFYDYSQSGYIDSKTKIKIICPSHGEFFQTPSDHLQGNNCNKCSLENKRLKIIIDFKEKAKIVHNNFYDYSQSEYIDSRIKIKIICPVHGEFFQRYGTHLNGSICPKCDSDSRRLSQDIFLEKANKVHNNYYKYPENIITTKIKLKIICPKHGDFFQTPSQHLQGVGCSKCHLSRGELKIEKYLKNNSIDYILGKTFENCKNIKKLPFDFYLPNYNICIEFDGEQHFVEIPYWGGKEGFKKRQLSDQIKTDYCLKNNIKLLRIPYTDFDRIEEILKEHLKKSSLDISKTSL